MAGLYVCRGKEVNTVCRRPYSCKSLNSLSLPQPSSVSHPGEHHFVCEESRCARKAQLLAAALNH